MQQLNHNTKTQYKTRKNSNNSIMAMTKSITLNLIRNGGLDAFLVWELENGASENMDEIKVLLFEMGCSTLPEKIIIRNHYLDKVWTEFSYNTHKSKYCQTTLDEDTAYQPARKK